MSAAHFWHRIATERSTAIANLEQDKAALLATLRDINDSSRIVPGYTRSSALALKLAGIGTVARAAIAAAEVQS